MMRYAISKCEGLEIDSFQNAYDKAFNDMIEEYGEPAMFLIMSGRIEWVCCTLLQCGFDDPNLVHELVDVYGEERRKSLKFFPDAIRVLSSLKNKCRLSLVTNGPTLTIMLEKVIKLARVLDELFKLY